LVVSIEPDNGYTNTGPSLADYTSITLQMYLETLEHASTAQLLDIGSVCEENIKFFAQRVKRFHVCDMFLRLNRNQRKGLSAKKVCEHLDYEPHSFDGINLWDFIDHLDDNEATKLVKLCHSLLKPKGMMIVISFEEHSAPSQINSFIAQDGYRLTFRLQNHLDLPYYYRSNRILTDMLSEFASVKSFIYRNGVREFLCKRD
jgi:cyclopropane fatty-acyl-phospholipid synthase-like methyltransferase